MKVQAIEIVNFKGISTLEVSPNGRNVYAIAANGKGKTSFLDAVFKTLTGKNLPSKMVKNGEKRGSINIDLGNLNVGATISAKDDGKLKLTVSSPDGEVYSSPRTMLDAVVGIIDFDIAGFMALTPRKQAEQLKKMLGLDTTKVDAEYAKVFAERAESNQNLKWLENNSKPYNPTATVAIDVASLEERRMDVARINANRESAVKTEARLGREIEEGERELEKLKSQLATLDALLTAKVNERADVDAWLEDNPATPDEAIVAEITAARAHNEAVAITTRELAHRADIKKEEKNNARLVRRLGEIEAQKAEMIAAVPMPVPGLTFTDEGLFLDGLPFEDNQINTSRKIISGLQLCSALHKQVNIARFDGSLLDNASLAEVEEWAAKAGIQLFIEMVARDANEGLKIEISE